MTARLKAIPGYFNSTQTKSQRVKDHEQGKVLTTLTHTKKPTKTQIKTANMRRSKKQLINKFSIYFLPTPTTTTTKQPKQ